MLPPVTAIKIDVMVGSRPPLLNQIAQHLLGFIATLETVEREPELFSHHHAARKRRGHLRGEIDHSLPVADSAIGQEQIDHHP